MPPPVTARGFWGSADSSPNGVWGEAPAAFLLLRLFSTVISNTYMYTSRDIRITRACMDSDEKTVHSSQCYGSYCSAIKFVTQRFVTEACTWPATCRSINDSCMFYYNISIELYSYLFTEEKNLRSIPFTSFDRLPQFLLTRTIRSIARLNISLIRMYEDLIRSI